MKYRIQSIAKYLPGQPVPAARLELAAGMKRGWIDKNSGVSYRHRAAATDSVCKLAARALRRAVVRGKSSFSDLDQLIFASGTFDHPIPYNACLLKRELHLDQLDFPCFDIDATCLSFLVALDLAFDRIQRRGCDTLAIVSSEIASRSLNPNDPKTYSLFGDGAAAVILEGSETEGFTFLGSHFENYCEGADLAIVPAGGLKQLGNDPSIPTEDFYFQMHGRKLVALTFKKLPAFLERLEAQTGVPIDGYDHYIFHQASKFGNELFLKQYGIPEEKTHRGLERYGNCISASIPLGLEELINERGVQTGERVLLLGTAAGLSLGGVALQF